MRLCCTVLLPPRNRSTFHNSSERLAASINLQHHAGSALAQVAEYHTWLACNVWTTQALNVTGPKYPALRASFLRVVLLSLPSEQVCTGGTVGRSLDKEPPDPCHACVGRTEPVFSGSQSIWFLKAPVMHPCISGLDHTWPSDHFDRFRNSWTLGWSSSAGSLTSAESSVFLASRRHSKHRPPGPGHREAHRIEGPHLCSQHLSAELLPSDRTGGGFRLGFSPTRNLLPLFHVREPPGVERTRGPSCLRKIW